VNAAAPSEDNVAADALLHGMKKGTDCDDQYSAGALGGYAKRKFVERAALIYDCCCEVMRLGVSGAAAHSSGASPATQALAARASASLRRVRCAVSIGGGPANDLCGWHAFERELQAASDAEGEVVAPAMWSLRRPCGRCADPAVVEAERVALWCLDFASAKWAPLVAAADSALGGGRVRGARCDVVDGAWPPAELSPREADEVGGAELYIFSYVLIECRGRWHRFVEAVWARAKPGALFLFADPTDWQLRELVPLLRKSSPACEGAVWLDVRAPGAPSALMLVRPEASDCSPSSRGALDHAHVGDGACGAGSACGGESGECSVGAGHRAIRAALAVALAAVGVVVVATVALRLSPKLRPRS
jgi:hypothetical protein